MRLFPPLPRNKYAASCSDASLPRDLAQLPGSAAIPTPVSCLGTSHLAPSLRVDGSSAGCGRGVYIDFPVLWVIRRNFTNSCNVQKGGCRLPFQLFYSRNSGCRRVNRREIGSQVVPCLDCYLPLGFRRDTPSLPILLVFINIVNFPTASPIRLQLKLPFNPKPPLKHPSSKLHSYKTHPKICKSQ